MFNSNGTFVNKDMTSSEIIMWSVAIFVFEMASLKINEFFTCEFWAGKWRKLVGRKILYKLKKSFYMFWFQNLGFGRKDKNRRR